jgi:hypothetical protein
MTAPWFANTLAGANPSSGTIFTTTSAQRVTSSRVDRSSIGSGGATTDYLLGEQQTARTSGGCGFAKGFAAFASGLTLQEWLNSSGTAVLRVRTASTSTVALEYWNGATWVAVGSAVTVTTDTPYRFLVDFSGMGTAAGALSFDVVNTATEASAGSASASGLDLTSATNIARSKTYTAHNGGDATARFGEMFMKDGSAMAAYVYANRPTGNGTDNTDGTGSVLSIDDQGTANHDADFVSLASSGNRRSFTCAARSVGGRTPKGVGAALRLRCGASGPTQVKPYLLIGGTRYYHPSSPVTLTTSFQSKMFIWETNPATSAAWTAAAVESAALEFGIEVV